MNERRVTLADIAGRAHVHVTTVSLALRNHPRLPSQTRERIRALAEQMGYRPDPLLRALVAYRGKTMPRRHPPTLAFVTDWSSCWGWKKSAVQADFYVGAERKAQALGFQLDHVWRRDPEVGPGRLAAQLAQRGISGLLMVAQAPAAELAQDFDWERFSAVKIDGSPQQPALHNVADDRCGIVRLAMQRAFALGYRRIGFAMHRSWDHDRLWSAGFLSEQQELAEADRIPLLSFSAAEPGEDGAETMPMEAFRRWYERYRPELIIGRASCVEPRLAELGLRVPADVALADLFLTRTDGSMAGVRQNHATVGETAVEILAAQLQHNEFGVPEVPVTTLVAGTWFDGGSCPALR